MAKKYVINPKYKNSLVGVKTPPYERPGKGIFILDDKLTQKDMSYLYEVEGLTNHINILEKLEKGLQNS